MKSMKYFIYFSALALVVFSCGPTTERLVTKEHDEDITVSTTWGEGTHIITGEINVNATLIIAPGSIIKFEKGAGLLIGYGGEGTLIADGTIEKPITFTSAATAPAAGDWDYIWFDDGTTPNSSMTHCIIEYGGGYTYSGMVHLEGSNITIENTVIQYSARQGVSTDDDGYFNSFENNTIVNCDGNPIKIEANWAHTIGTGNTITTNKGILVDAGYYMQSEETWLMQTCPYILDGELNIGEESGATLIIEPGTEIQFTEGSGILVGYGSNKFGTIIAEGTTEKPITFTSSASTPSPGDWDYIWFDDGTMATTSFKNCIIEYGGGYSYSGMVHLEYASVSFDNCTFQYSSDIGVSLDEGYFASFTGNTITECATYPIEIDGNYAHTIGTGNTITTTKGILVNDDDFVEENETWLKQTCPYIIKGQLSIASESGSTLTIEPGTTIWFTEGSGIMVGYGSSKYGKLIANGSSETITFTSAAPTGGKSAGDWEYIWFDDGTMSGTILNACTIEYGGGYAYSGMIHCDNTNEPTITNNTIQYSANHGISIDNCAPTVSGNTFNNITGNDIYTQ